MRERRAAGAEEYRRQYDPRSPHVPEDYTERRALAKP